MRHTALPLLLTAVGLGLVSADGPGDNLPDKVRRVPPPGIAVPEADRTELLQGAANLQREIQALRSTLKGPMLALLPDVEVYHKAVHDALTYDEIYDRREIAVARKHLQTGTDRARALKDGKAPWAAATGLIVRGYVSTIDGSVQPYGLVVPKDYKPGEKKRRRLDLWCHGRGEKLTELAFLRQRESSPGEFVPDGAIVLHLYGRYCCANKFAGEVDCFEAMAHAKRHYPIDENRVVMRGFSMGGAACWQFLTHYPDVWAAAAPGAGFSETPDFLRVFQKEKLAPTWYERKLWHWYDCTDYALNTFNLPVVAYSGENDSQKQAADIMAKAIKAEGLDLVHISGPKTGHRYHPEAKKQINQLIDRAAAKGRDPHPKKVKFTTYTLRYNRCFWVSLHGLGEHWKKAVVEAEVTGPGAIAATTKNVTSLALTFGRDQKLLGAGRAVQVTLDGQELTVAGARWARDGSWAAAFTQAGGKWAVARGPNREGKAPGLQGPIDDAFLSRFLMVRPTGQPLNDRVGKWADAELKHAVVHWRRQFRGEAPVKDDRDVSDDDIKNANLVLWGDPSSNAVLKKIAGKLPVRWGASGITLPGTERTYGGDRHVVVMVYPNPLNPRRYVVLNSGFTFREYDYLNNARQVAKLPDFAVIDVTSPPTSRAPGKVVLADFFDEQWRLPKEPGKARK